MQRVQIAMSLLFGSLFFLLLPLYDILLQQNMFLDPIIKIIFILILLLTIVSALISAKKIAYISHNFTLSQHDKTSSNISFLSSTILLNPFIIAALSFFILFLLLKTIFLSNVCFFLSSLFGQQISFLLSIVFFTVFLFSSYVLIRNHIDEKYYNILIESDENEII